MKYLTGVLPAKAEYQNLLREVNVGLLSQPVSTFFTRGLETWDWAADNGCFNDRWDEEEWWSYLIRAQSIPNCMWATVPDVVGDHQATLERWAEYSSWVALLGFRVAFVAQDGCIPSTTPWDEMDCLFIGGSTKWKLSEEARILTEEGKKREKHVHMGRVNSLKRLRLAAWWGCDTVDGTFLSRSPDFNTHRLVAFMRALEADQRVLRGFQPMETAFGVLSGD